jgi:hypothetical protein
MKKGASFPIIILSIFGIILLSLTIYIFFSSPNLFLEIFQTKINEQNINLSIKNVYEENGSLSINIVRNEGEGRLIGIKFILSAGENYIETITKSSNLSESENESFILTPAEFTINEVKNIFIAPISESSDKKETVERITDNYHLILNNTEIITNETESCIPNCINLQCGPDPTCGELCGACDGNICQNGTCVCVSKSTNELCSEGCGIKTDNCGKGVNCGGCNSTSKCQDNLCVAKTCKERCIDSRYNCGGCGCGNCSSGQVCTNPLIGGVCQTLTCAEKCNSTGKTCGTYQDCNCGTCPTGQICSNGICNYPEFSARVYETDPIVTSSTKIIQLKNLDGSGYLNGTRIEITGITAYSSNNIFIYLPADYDSPDYNTQGEKFDAAMAYYSANEAYEFYTLLGFSPDKKIKVKLNAPVCGSCAEQWLGYTDGKENIFIPTPEAGKPDYLRDVKGMFHEYTHIAYHSFVSMIITVEDEGYAIYFPSSYTNTPRYSEYLNPLNPKNLETVYTGEDNPFAFAAALWGVRGSIGQAITDRLIYKSWELQKNPTGNYKARLQNGAEDGLVSLVEADWQLYNGVHASIIKDNFQQHGIVCESCISA